MFAQVRDRVVSLAAKRDAFGRFCTAVYLKLAHHRDMLGMEAEVVGYEDLLNEFPGVRNTRDSADLADRLLVRWMAKQPPEPAQREGSGKDNDAGEKADGCAAGSPKESADSPAGAENSDVPRSEESSARPAEQSVPGDGREVEKPKTGGV